MRIGLLSPSFWPEVRRGTERLVHDLALALVERGHDVSVVTSHPGPTAESYEEGIRVLRYRRLPAPSRLAMYEHHVASIPRAFLEVVRGRFDVVHAFFPTDAWAAVRARRLGGTPVVFSSHGIFARRHLVHRRYRLHIMAEAIREADAFSVLSEAAASEARRFFGVEPRILPGGVRLSDFALEPSRAAAPTVVCAASLADDRKRARVLFSAWEQVRQEIPTARLCLVRQRDPLEGAGASDARHEGIVLRGGIELPLPEGAEWVRADTTAELARVYADAWVSVLPAVDEAFGLVVVESLAAGTPVVAARSGACPELLTTEALGSLFEPDESESLARDLIRRLHEPPDRATTRACRTRAGDFEWSGVADLYEHTYVSILR